MLTALAPFDGDTILSMADAKVQLNLADGDTYHEPAITSARDTAIEWVEGYAERSLQERQFLLTADQFTSVISFPIGPVTAIDEVSYYDGDGTDTTVDAADYYLGSNKLAAAVNSSWPYANGLPGGVRITFTAGYATAADIPAVLLSAVKLAMTAFFENRTDPDLSGAMKMADRFRAVL